VSLFVAEQEEQQLETRGVASEFVFGEGGERSRGGRVCRVPTGRPDSVGGAAALLYQITAPSTDSERSGHEEPLSDVSFNLANLSFLLAFHNITDGRLVLV
jgi:hypothetical protein